MLENSSWHESGVFLRDVEWRRFSISQGAAWESPSTTPCLKKPHCLPSDTHNSMEGNVSGFLQELPSSVSTRTLSVLLIVILSCCQQRSWHLVVTIVGWRILHNALVSPSQAPPSSLSSLLFHEWDTKSIRHLRLCSTLRNAIRIQNGVETLNIKSAEFHFHWYSSEDGACLSYSEHLQFNRKGASAKLPSIDTVPYRKYLTIQKEGPSREDENVRDMQML